MQNGMYTRTEGGDAPGVYARFFMEPVQDPIATAQAGRPIFREEERVEIILPGNDKLAPVKRVDDEIRARFPRAYEAFKKGIEVALEGTPLEEWPILNRAQVAELKHLNFRTVEDIANAPDTSIQRIGMGGYGLRERAKAFLDDAAAVALNEKLEHELGAAHAEIASLKRQVEEQGEILRQVHAQMVARENAPHPLLTQTQADFDPMARLQPVDEAPAQSALGAFENVTRRRPGRPPKAEQPAA